MTKGRGSTYRAEYNIKVTANQGMGEPANRTSISACASGQDATVPSTAVRDRWSREQIMNVSKQTLTQDAALAEELKQHHARMVADLDRLSAEFSAAIGSDSAAARSALARWIEHVLVPHAEEEEQTSYRAAGELPAGRLLIETMVIEHVLIRRLAALFAEAANPAVAATYGRTVFEVFDSHQRTENEIILPLLVADDSVSLVEVMSAAHGHHDDHDRHAHQNHHDHHEQ
ncbi:MAG: hemerythrin domain-containing protein [Streptosporangiaceae bacterium]